eukprot:3339571-Pyramimonas_sp.AAC.1
MPAFAAQRTGSRRSFTPPAQELPAAAGSPPPGPAQRGGARAGGKASRRTGPIYWARLRKGPEYRRAHGIHGTRKCFA